MSSEATPMRVSIDRDVCMATGFCGRIAPQLFRLDDAGEFSVVLHAEVPPGLDALAREAENNCPTGAITLTEG